MKENIAKLKTDNSFKMKKEPVRHHSKEMLKSIRGHILDRIDKKAIKDKSINVDHISTD